MKVHNWWSLAGAIILAIIIGNVLVRGNTSVSLANVFSQFFVNTIKALKVEPER